jgi:hypothetical protein
LLKDIDWKSFFDNSPAPSERSCGLIRGRAGTAGSKTLVGNHTLRATGITAYLKNGGVLENAAPWRIIPRRARCSFMIGGGMNLRLGISIPHRTDISAKATS